MKKKLSGVLALILAVIFVISVTGCGKKSSSGSQSSSVQEETVNPGIKAEDLFADREYTDFEGLIEENTVDPVYTDFAVKLVQNVDQKDENLLISPMSVMYGLMLPANGAHGNTLAQIEKVFGENAYTLNRYLYFALEGEYSGDSAKFNIGNSLWINKSSGYAGNDKYLDEVYTFYNARAFLADFSAVNDDIGLWLKDKGFDSSTQYIPDNDDLMTSINSLKFSAPWVSALTKADTDAEFTSSDGSKVKLEFVSGNAERSLKSDKAQGFAKEFKGGHYAMAVLMPNEGVSVEDYLKSLTGDSLMKMLSTAEEKNIGFTMPKIDQSSDFSAKDALKAMGITDAFDSGKADFSDMGSADKNLYLSDIAANAELKMDENSVNSSSQKPDAGKATKSDAQITVNRPFVYMIYDLGSNIPKFIGTLKKAA